MMQPTPYFLQNNIASSLPPEWYNTVDPNYLGRTEANARQTVTRIPGMTNLQADIVTGPGGFDLMRRNVTRRFPTADSNAIRQALAANYQGRRTSNPMAPVNRTMIPERQRAIAARQAQLAEQNKLTLLNPSRRPPFAQESPDMVFRDGYFTPSVAPYLHDPTPTGTFVRSEENPRESAFWQRHDILNPTFRQRGTSAEEGAGLFSAAGMKLASEMIRDATKGQGQGRAFTSRMGRRNIQPYMTAADVAMFASPYLEEERNGR